MEELQLTAREADGIGRRLAQMIDAGQTDRAYMVLAPILAKRTPFRLLDRIGLVVGALPLKNLDPFLDWIAADKTEGGWVVIGSALRQQLDRGLTVPFARCRTAIVDADVWYGADILGERVPGPALLLSFQEALALLSPWREDSNRWVRRAVGVAAHFWAKRSRGAEALAPQAGALLSFLEPMFEEWEMDAVKGVGWGLKTLGRYYPELMVHWMRHQVVERQRRHRALIQRKALTYLSDGQRVRAVGDDL